MKGIAKRLAPEEEEFWGVVGLLHDLDEEPVSYTHLMCFAHSFSAVRRGERN